MRENVISYCFNIVHCSILRVQYYAFISCFTISTYVKCGPRRCCKSLYSKGLRLHHAENADKVLGKIPSPFVSLHARSVTIPIATNLIVLHCHSNLSTKNEKEKEKSGTPRLLPYLPHKDRYSDLRVLSSPLPRTQWGLPLFSHQNNRLRSNPHRVPVRSHRLKW